MDRPLEIAFHNISSSKSLEALIREKFARLEKRFPRLVGARVSVEALHRQHRAGNIYECHVVLSVPGRDLAVTHEPHRAKEEYAHPDVKSPFARHSRRPSVCCSISRTSCGRTRQIPPAPPSPGQVALIEPGADHGFILTNTGSQLYFHRDSVTNADFANLKPGQEVHYVEEEGDTGPVATKIRIPETKSA